MNLSQIARPLLAVFSLLLLSACNPKPSYTTYEDCILANIKANQSREAVLVIRHACRAKFPEPPPSQREIEADEANAGATANDAAQAAADAAAQAADARQRQ